MLGSPTHQYSNHTPQWKIQSSNHTPQCRKLSTQSLFCICSLRFSTPSLTSLIFCLSRLMVGCSLSQDVHPLKGPMEFSIPVLVLDPQMEGVRAT